MPRFFLQSVAALALLVVATGACAEVSEADAGHLILHYAVPVKAEPAKAYAAAIEVARWWSSEHTYSGDAKNLHLDAKAGGCWCETLKDGGGVEHMRVVLAMPGRMLRLKGGLGPLQSGAVEGTLTFEFKSKDANEIAVTYAVSGYFAGGLDKVAGGVDHVLGDQLQRLQQLIDTGSVAAAKPKS